MIAYLITSVAISGVFGRVNPSPIGVNNHRALLLRAAISRALLPVQRRVGFFLLCPSLLGPSDGQKGIEKESTVVHCCTVPIEHETRKERMEERNESYLTCRVG